MSDEEFINRPHQLSDTEEQIEQNIVVDTKIKTKHVWLFQLSFDTAKQALQLIKSEEYWAVGKMCETIAGRKQPYRCNKAPKRGNQCARASQLLYHAEDLRVTLFVTDADHNHDEIVADIVKTGINKATKDVIDHLIEQKVSSKNILEYLVKEASTNLDITVPSERQLYNYSAAKRKKVGSTQMNFDELCLWCICCELPDQH